MSEHEQALKHLSKAGVSIWLDDLSRKRLNSGSLAADVAENHIVGVTSNPSIFANAIGSPQADEVATACCIGTLRQVRNGTVSEPPPMPKIAEAQPMKLPAMVRPTLPGTVRLALGLKSNASCTAMINAKTPMIFCKCGPEIASAVNAPNPAPMRMPTVIQAKIGQRTAPRR